MDELTPPPCRVLVVEDSDEMAVVIERILTRAGFLVVVASTGAAALDEWTRGGVDLVLIDLGLPDISGETLFAELQRRAPSFPCVFLTANNSIDKAVDLMRIGALDYIVKPIEREHFAVRMSTVRDRILSTRELIALRKMFTPSEATSTAFVGGQDPKMLALLKRVTLAARTEAPVLIAGESGTGKELVARAVHQLSRRGNGPFVAVNTAAISMSLWESEFFGHVKGAFTDARADAPGLIAAAEKGTLFLDEVGEIPLAAQAKLLRFIQDRQYRPVGSTRETTADTRIVAATHRDLKKLVAAGEFREDLYYRLHVVPIDVPALRDRRGDIPMLAQHFVARYSREFDVPVQGFTPSALARLLQYDWPGNVRELENLIQQVVAVATDSLIHANEVPLPSSEFVSLATAKASDAPTAPSTIESLAASRLAAVREFERNYLTRVLTLTEGNITRAAALCQVPRKTLWRLLKANEIIAVREGVPSKPGRPRSPTR